MSSGAEPQDRHVHGADDVAVEHRRHGPDVTAPSDDDAAQLRRLARQIRRHKAVLERRNPLEDGDYVRRFEALVRLEAQRRDLASRRASAHGPGDR